MGRLFRGHPDGMRDDRVHPVPMTSRAVTITLERRLAGVFARLAEGRKHDRQNDRGDRDDRKHLGDRESSGLRNASVQRLVATP